MRIFGYSSSFCMKTMNWISAVIDYVQFSVFIKESVSAFYVAFICPFFVSELAIISEMYQSNIDIFGRLSLFQPNNLTFNLLTQVWDIIPGDKYSSFEENRYTVIHLGYKRSNPTYCTFASWELFCDYHYDYHNC